MTDSPRPFPHLLLHLPSGTVSAVVVLLALLLAGCGTGDDGRPTAGGNQPGAPAPAWSAQTLDGQEFALSDLEGDVVMLNVWATWCAPCIREMPKLDALHREYGDRGLHVLGASVDRAGAANRVRDFIRENDIAFQILLDPDQQVMNRFRTIAVPETFLIGHDGTILHRWIGEFDPMAPNDRARVTEALEARASASEVASRGEAGP